MTSAMTSPIALEHRHLRLAAQVFETIKRDIISSVLTPNTQLSEADLSKRLGVSRTPVREALIKLSEDGLVKIVPQVGTFVAPISIESVKEAQFIREHLECALIGDAARLMDAETLYYLRENLDRQKRAASVTEDWPAFLALDEAFHQALATVSGHPIAWRVIQQSQIHFYRVRVLSFRLPAQMARVVEQHRKIVEALAVGDGPLAQKALRGHLDEAFATLERLGLEDSGDDIVPPARQEA
jgi:DNA-binding GntR family transcriptional regulator